MFDQLFLGTIITLVSVIFGAVMWWALNGILAASADWAKRPPVPFRSMLLFCLVIVWTMLIMMFGVALWASVFVRLETFADLEEAVYYSLVAYTTLGLGDVIVPKDWRLLGGMTGANGFLVFGLLTAMLTDSMRMIHTRR